MGEAKRKNRIEDEVKARALAIGGSWDGEWLDREGPASATGFIVRVPSRSNQLRFTAIGSARQSVMPAVDSQIEEYQLQTLCWKHERYQFWILTDLTLDSAFGMLMTGYRQMAETRSEMNALYASWTDEIKKSV